MFDEFWDTSWTYAKAQQESREVISSLKTCHTPPAPNHFLIPSWCSVFLTGSLWAGAGRGSEIAADRGAELARYQLQRIRKEQTLHFYLDISGTVFSRGSQLINVKREQHINFKGDLCSLLWMFNQLLESMYSSRRMSPSDSLEHMKLLWNKSHEVSNDILTVFFFENRNYLTKLCMTDDYSIIN